MASALRIDVFVELVCPWCLIGKRHLARALESFAQSDPGVPVQVHWRPVQLIAQVPAEGWPFAEFYLRRLGSPEAVRDRQAQVQAASAQAGIAIDLTRIQRFPNTARAHRLLDFAAVQQPARVDALLERLFDAYFRRGEDIGSSETLLAIAHETGLDVASVRPWLQAPPRSAEPAPVTGVPLFVFDGRFALSGAQAPQALWSAMRRASEGAKTA
jgi:predicted DsbA family dithiol-disulfide isomerase